MCFLKLECDTFYPISGSYFSYHKVALENAQAMMRIVLLTNPLKLDLTLVGYCKNSYSYQPEMNIGTYFSVPKDIFLQAAEFSG